MKRLFLSVYALCLLFSLEVQAASGYDPEKQPDAMQYFTPVGGAYFVGDCIPFSHDGTYYLYWLLGSGLQSAQLPRPEGDGRCRGRVPPFRFVRED